MDFDVYLVPVGDEHFNEIVSPADDRVKEITGFTGEYGTAIVGNVNALFTSLQYREMAAQQVKDFEIVIEGMGIDIPTYLAMRGVRTAGISSRTIASKEFKKLKEALKAKGITLVPVKSDLVDEVWKTRPKRKYNSIFSIDRTKLSKYIDIEYVKLFREMAIGPPRTLDGSVGDDGEGNYNLDQTLCGESYIQKISRIQSKLQDYQGLVVSSLSSIGWLTNLRGTDITYSPTFYSFVYMTKKSVTLFTAQPVEIKGGVEVQEYSKFYKFIKGVKEREVLVSGDVNYEIYRRLKKPVYTDLLLKDESTKNNIELFGFKNTGVKDGAALVQLFAWIEKNIDNNITEKDVQRQLIKFKSATKGYFSESFEPLIGSGPNSAKIYHKPSNRVLQRNEILLIDSGTQYYHGTTDMTRTLVFGTPTQDMIRHYTIVLKSLVDAKFLAKSTITGKMVDRKSRKYLKQIGKDYPTATGHSVGYFGEVHEKLPKVNYEDADVLPLFSVYTLEPTYFDDEMGIRIEDMVFNNRRNNLYYQLNLTYVPLDLKLIDPEELSDTKLRRVNTYSAKVREFLTPLLKDKPDAMAYLLKNTKKLKKKEPEI